MTKPHFANQPFKALQDLAPGISPKVHWPSHRRQLPAPSAHHSQLQGWPAPGQEDAPPSPLLFTPSVPSPPPGSYPPKPQTQPHLFEWNILDSLRGVSPSRSCSATAAVPFPGAQGSERAAMWAPPEPREARQGPQTPQHVLTELTEV